MVALLHLASPLFFEKPTPLPCCLLHMQFRQLCDDGGPCFDLLSEVFSTCGYVGLSSGELLGLIYLLSLTAYKACYVSYDSTSLGVATGLTDHLGHQENIRVCMLHNKVHG